MVMWPTTSAASSGSMAFECNMKSAFRAGLCELASKLCRDIIAVMTHGPRTVKRGTADWQTNDGNMYSENCVDSSISTTTHKNPLLMPRRATYDRILLCRTCNKNELGAQPSVPVKRIIEHGEAKNSKLHLSCKSY